MSCNSTATLWSLQDLLPAFACLSWGLGLLVSHEVRVGVDVWVYVQLSVLVWVSCVSLCFSMCQCGCALECVHPICIWWCVSASVFQCLCASVIVSVHFGVCLYVYKGLCTEMVAL